MKSHLKLVAPGNENRKVTPTRVPNADLIRNAIARLSLSFIGMVYGRSRLAIWNGPRTATLHVRGVKNGKPATHPIRGDELRALRKLRADQGPHTKFVFTSERGTPFTPDALNRQIKHIGERAKLGFPVHIHMLRHACGYKLANDGHDTRAIQDYLGHKSIQHTVRYTELSPVRFKGFFAN